MIFGYKSILNQVKLFLSPNYIELIFSTCETVRLPEATNDRRAPMRYNDNVLL